MKPTHDIRGSYDIELHMTPGQVHLLQRALTQYVKRQRSLRKPTMSPHLERTRRLNDEMADEVLDTFRQVFVDLS